MKSQKNIESVVREEEKKLTIQPSAQAWRKLERRLDHHRRPKNGTVVAMRQWMAIAATLLVLVVSLFIWSSTEKDLKYDYLPTIVEEIGDNDSCQPYCMVIEARKALPAFYAVPSKDENKDQS